MGNAARTARLPIGMFARQIDGVPVQVDLARAFGNAAEDLQQFGLAVPGNTRDAQNFACAHREGDVLQALNAIFIRDGQVLDLKDCLSGRCRLLVHAQKNFPAHHQFCQLGGRGLRGFHRCRHFPAPHHGNCICDIHDFTQLVCDQNDGFAFLLQSAQDAEQMVGLRWCQHAGGFVQNQDIRFAVQ